MKTLLAIMLLALSCGAQALNVTINPAQPVVVTSDAVIDGVTIKGPWFGAQYTITNTVSVTLTLNYFTERVDAANGTSVGGLAVSLGNIELAPGQSFTTPTLYTQNMPISNAPYTITGEISGWASTKDAPSQQIDKVFTFQTK